MASGSSGLQDFEVICKLGEGSFAEVFKVKRKADSQFYAMKKIRMTRIKDKDRCNALNEVRILASQQGEHIVEFRESFYDHHSAILYIIMELASRGDLQKLVQDTAKQGTQLPESQIWKAIVHIARGLQTLHHKKVLHRDLKAANVFITDQGVYKLGDLNVSKVAKDDLATTQTGTPYYASPEVWKDQPYGSKSDMWSLGCVIYEMAAQRPPFMASDIQVLYKKVMAGYYPRVPCLYSKDLVDTISLLLRLDPIDRPSASQLLVHPAIQRHYSSDKSESFCWEKDQLGSETLCWEKDALLSTIKLPARNYKMIGEMLPKAQYNRRRRGSYKESTQQSIVGSFFKQNLSTQGNEQMGIVSKFRISSMYEKDRQSKREQLRKPEGEEGMTKRERERAVSNYQAIRKGQQSSINDIPVLSCIPQKGPGTATAQTAKQQRGITPASDFSKPTTTTAAKLPELQPNRALQKKIESLMGKLELTETSRGGKENLRRVGEQVVSGLSRRSVRQYK